MMNSNSLLFKYLVATVPIVLLATMVVLVTYETISYHRAKESLQSDLKIRTDLTSAELASPLWNLDKERSELILNSVLHNPNIEGARILDEEGALFLEKGKIEIGQADQFLTRSAITFSTDTHENEAIGELKLYASFKHLEGRHWKEVFFQLFLVFLVLSLALLISIYFSRRLIISPLKHLNDGLNNVANNETNTHLNYQGTSEFDRVIESFNKMIDARAERDRFSEILEGTNVGTWEWDVETGKTVFNDEWSRIIGYELSELEPVSIDTWLKYAHPDDLKHSEEQLNLCFNKEIDFYAVECRMRHKNGEWVWVSDRGKVVKWTEDGKPKKMAGTHTDITERIRIQKELEIALIQMEKAQQEASNANLAKSDFLANMSHELRTPMMGIRGVLDLLRDDEVVHNQAHELLDDLDQASKSLMGLLDDVLDLSKIEAGKLDLNYQACEPAKIINSLANVFKPKASEKGISIETNARECFGYFCQLDDLRFRQILSNLLNNAVKFTEKGYIKIDMNIVSKGESGFLSVTVKDTGIGMSTEAQKHIFGRFNQAEQGTTRKFGGTGLGLAIARELTELFNGELDVKSEENVGTTFSLTIPTQKAEPVVKNEGHVDLLPMHILLAEDNPINQKVVSAMLKKHNHNVEIANNGLEAVSLAGEKPFDLILMDMNMPEMNGLEATKSIRKGNGNNASVAIIAFTADAIETHHKDFFSVGVNGIITKPVSFDKLSSEIIRVLGEKEKSQ
jgi:PAS domain S-box-containing protein